MAYQLIRGKSGAFSVHDTGYGETMHPGLGPWGEATTLYVHGGGLPGLLAAPPRSPTGEVVVFDVGLGGAANALAAVECHQERLRMGLATPPLRLVSFENQPAGARFALDEARTLGYPAGQEDVLEDLLDHGEVQLPGGLRWELRLGDFTRLVTDEPARADLIFYDPFSPGTNPEMWSVACLEAVFQCRRPGGETRLVTYSSSYGVRAAMLAVGFFVGEGPRTRPHGQTTIAATRLSSLEYPLNPGWLARWRKVTDPWPPMTRPEQRPKLREILLDHPQWQSESGNPAPPAETDAKPKFKSRRARRSR